MDASVIAVRDCLPILRSQAEQLLQHADYPSHLRLQLLSKVQGTLTTVAKAFQYVAKALATPPGYCGLLQLQPGRKDAAPAGPAGPRATEQPLACNSSAPRVVTLVTDCRGLVNTNNTCSFAVAAHLFAFAATDVHGSAGAAADVLLAGFPGCAAHCSTGDSTRDTRDAFMQLVYRLLRYREVCASRASQHLIGQAHRDASASVEALAATCSGTLQVMGANGRPTHECAVTFSSSIVLHAESQQSKTAVFGPSFIDDMSLVGQLVTAVLLGSGSNESRMTLETADTAWFCVFYDVRNAPSDEDVLAPIPMRQICTSLMANMRVRDGTRVDATMASLVQLTTRAEVCNFFLLTSDAYFANCFNLIHKK